MMFSIVIMFVFFFFQAEDGIRDVAVTGVQTCALPISALGSWGTRAASCFTMRCGSPTTRRRLPRAAGSWRRRSGSPARLGVRGARGAGGVTSRTTRTTNRGGGSVTHEGVLRAAGGGGSGRGGGGGGGGGAAARGRPGVAPRPPPRGAGARADAAAPPR